MLIPNGVDRHFPVFHMNILSFWIRRGGDQKEGVSCCTHNTCISKTPAVGFPLLRDSIIKSALSEHITPAQELKPFHQWAPSAWRFVTYHTRRLYHPLKCTANQCHTPVSYLALIWDQSWDLRRKKKKKLKCYKYKRSVWFIIGMIHTHSHSLFTLLLSRDEGWDAAKNSFLDLCSRILVASKRHSLVPNLKVCAPVNPFTTAAWRKCISRWLTRWWPVGVCPLGGNVHLQMQRGVWPQADRSGSCFYWMV